MSRLFSSIVLASACLAAACSPAPDPGNGDAGPSCALYQVPAGTDLTKPTVSFSNDVIPVFKQSCGLSSSCHGSPNGGRIFLGSSQIKTDPVTVRGNIVGVVTTDAPALQYVKAGDPGQSFLMHKMDGDLCAIASQCVGNDCGVSMPQGSPVLDVATRDIVRRWIAQGPNQN